MDDAVAGALFPEVLDAGACVCAAVPDFFVFALFFVAFESLLDESPVCGADCDRAVTTPGHSKNARRISWTTVRFFPPKLLLHHGERAPLRHTHKLGWAVADGFQTCAGRLPHSNARMMSKNVWEVKKEGVCAIWP